MKSALADKHFAGRTVDDVEAWFDGSRIVKIRVKLDDWSDFSAFWADGEVVVLGPEGEHEFAGYPITHPERGRIEKEATAKFKERYR